MTGSRCSQVDLIGVNRVKKISSDPKLVDNTGLLDTAGSDTTGFTVVANSISGITELK